MRNHPCQDIDGCEHHPEKCCECMLKEIDEQYLDAALLSIREVS